MFNSTFLSDAVWSRLHTGPAFQGLPNILKMSQGPVSISDKTSHRKSSWSLEVARLVVWIIASLWYMTGSSVAQLEMCSSNFITIVQFWIQISRLWYFVRSCNKRLYRILKQGPNPGLWSPRYNTLIMFLVPCYLFSKECVLFSHITKLYSV